MFGLQTGVGVKIPWPGYLDSPPTYLFLKAQQIPYDIKKKTVAVFHVILVIELIPMI